MFFRKSKEKETPKKCDEVFENDCPRPKHRNIFLPYRKRKRPLIIGICGRSTSGKSTVSKWLERDFPEDVLWISADYFFKIFGAKKILLKKKKAKTSWSMYSPDVDWEKLITAVKELKKNKPARVPSRKWIKISNKVIQPKPVIVVEGYVIFTNKKLFKLFDKKIFIEVSDMHMLYRRMLRNDRFANLKYIAESIIPASKRFEHSQKLVADIVLNGNKTTEGLYKSVLKTLKPKKKKSQ